MEKKEFLSFVKDYLKKQGFEKIKNRYYRLSDEFLCEIYVSKSYYGEFYYFDFYFHIGVFQKPYSIDRGGWETHTPYVGYRFIFSEDPRDAWCHYLDYDEATLSQKLDENMEKFIEPPFKYGKKHLLDNFGNPYRTFLDNDKIKELLSKPSL